MAIQKTLTTIAYSTTDTDETRRISWAIIPIPEGYKHINSTVRNTCELGNFSVSTIAYVRHATLQDQIVEVRVSALAHSRLFARSWIGIELAVIVEERR